MTYNLLPPDIEPTEGDRIEGERIEGDRIERDGRGSNRRRATPSIRSPRGSNRRERFERDNAICTSRVLFFVFFEVAIHTRINSVCSTYVGWVRTWQRLVVTQAANAL